LNTPLSSSASEDFELLLLQHSSLPIYRIGKPGSAAGRDKMLLTSSFDLASSVVVRFTDKRLRERAYATLRKAVEPSGVEVDFDNLNWYQKDSFDLVLELCRDSSLFPTKILQIAEVVSTRPLTSATMAPEEWAEQEAQRAAREERARLAREARIAEEREWEARRAAERAEAEKRRIEALEALVADRKKTGRYLSATHLPNEELQRVSNLLSRINIASNGHCKLNFLKGERLELDFYVLATAADEAEGAAEELRGVVTFDRKVREGQGAVLLVGRPFGYLTPKYPKSVIRGSKHWGLQIDVEKEFFKDALLALKPGIRGWDLPLDAAVLGFDPARSKKLGQSTPPAACAVRDAWTAGHSCDQALLHRHLQKFQINLGWEPPALRYLPKSPFEQDDGVPVALLRLIKDGTQVGFQKIRLDSGKRENLAFSGFSTEGAISTIWSAQDKVGVVTCLEDALALQDKHRIRSMVAPSPRAIEELPLPKEVQALTFYAPAVNSDAWTAAAETLASRAQELGVKFSVEFPLVHDSCKDLPFPAEWAKQLMK
jgi:hypothetical protein